MPLSGPSDRSHQEAHVRPPGATSEELQRIVAALLHALAGPLQTIDGFSLILQEDYADKPLDLEGWQHLQRIRNDAARLRSLLDDLSTYLQVLAAELSPEPADLTRIACDIAQELHYEEPERQVDWRIAPDLVFTLDLALAHRLLNELLRNAWKFTRKQPQAVIEIAPAAGAPLSLVIRDNGAGFNSQYADQLFAPFKRLHRHNEFAGTGMGLAIVQEIMRRHGGSVKAEGSPGQGAAITLQFPSA